ncbi:MAG: N5-carboxyaminoimidazole ribonucleotide synthase [Paracoccaceae bacterium]|nr:MAG: N5-carboxyaminoimidazole ribonucleotide synthase [Paracoccaceae bacterium]
MSAEPLPPGSVIGILGGGQLGRMLSMAAARLGLRCHIYDPAPDCPAGHVAAAVTTAAWDDTDALDAFAQSVAVVTLEFENVPLSTLRHLAARRPVRPGARALETAQDRLVEKAFLNGIGLATAPHAPVSSPADLPAALAVTGLPAIMKTRRMGYDGKGQRAVASAAEARAALRALGTGCILEGRVPFTAEISVIGARGMDGRVACYDPGMNRHEGGILRRTTVPAPVPRGLAADAVLATGRILNALDYVGVIGVEFFVTPAGLLVNEFAPRVHNSGHWTLEACLVSQFEQHIRAVAGWPIADAARHSDAVMDNLIGAEAEDWARLAAEPGVALHLYGKSPARPGRKMGHLTRLAPRG